MFNDEPNQIAEHETLVAVDEVYIVADCGHTLTSVVLIQPVDGRYRVVGHATAPTNISNMQYSIVQAIQAIERATGYEILTLEDDLIRRRSMHKRGIDQFGATISATSPLKVILVSSDVEDVALDSARHALSNRAARIVSILTGSNAAEEAQAVVDMMAQDPPDVVLFTSGSGRQAKSDLIKASNIIGIGLRQHKNEKTAVIYAGNSSWLEDVQDTVTEFVKIHQIDNIRPSSKQQKINDLRQLVDELVGENSRRRSNTVNDVAVWGQTHPVDTSKSIESFARYLSLSSKKSLLIVDVGSEALGITWAEKNRVETIISPELGLGKTLQDLFQHVNPDVVLGWIPRPKSDENVLKQLEIYLTNQSIYPDIVPMHAASADFAKAAFQTIVRKGIEKLTSFRPDLNAEALSVDQLIIRGEALPQMISTQQLILQIMNAVQLVGLTQVYWDKHSVLPILGHLASINPLAAVQAAENNVLVDLGWCLGIEGSGRSGRQAATISLESTQSNSRQIEALWGEATHIAIPASGLTDVTIKGGRRQDLGAGRGKPAILQNIPGGSKGILIDARGRPLKLPSDDESRIKLLQSWNDITHS